MSKLIRSYSAVENLPVVADGAVGSVNGVLYVRTGATWVSQGAFVAPILSQDVDDPVPTDLGGTGTDLSAATGLVKVAAGTVTAATLANADVAADAAIARSKLAAGTADHVAINSGAGVLTSEVRLAAVRGGTALDTSASTGVAKVAAGTWSVATVVDADVSASAALARTKIAAATAHALVTNDADGKPAAQVVPGTSGNVLASDGTNWVSTPWAGFRRYTHYIEYADLTDSDTQQTIALPGFPANAVPLFAVFELETAFDGPGLVDLNVQVGDADTDGLFQDVSLIGAGGFKQGAIGTLSGKGTFYAAFAPTATFTSTGLDLDNLEAGDGTVHIYYMTPEESQ